MLLLLLLFIYFLFILMMYFSHMTNKKFKWNTSLLSMLVFSSFFSYLNGFIIFMFLCNNMYILFKFFFPSTFLVLSLGVLNSSVFENYLFLVSCGMILFELILLMWSGIFYVLLMEFISVFFLTVILLWFFFRNYHLILYLMSMCFYSKYFDLMLMITLLFFGVYFMLMLCIQPVSGSACDLMLLEFDFMPSWLMQDNAVIPEPTMSMHEYGEFHINGDGSFHYTYAIVASSIMVGYTGHTMYTFFDSDTWGHIIYTLGAVGICHSLFGLFVSSTLVTTMETLLGVKIKYVLIIEIIHRLPSFLLRAAVFMYLSKHWEFWEWDYTPKLFYAHTVGLEFIFDMCSSTPILASVFSYIDTAVNYCINFVMFILLDNAGDLDDVSEGEQQSEPKKLMEKKSSVALDDVSEEKQKSEPKKMAMVSYFKS